MSAAPAPAAVAGPAPALSVVIPVRDGAAHIGATIETLRAQTACDFEAVVIDDGSTDGTGAIVEAAARDPGAPAIRLLRQDGAGVSAARNRGIAEARAPLVAFLDADDLWHPEKLARQIAAMRAHPEVDLCFTGFRIVDAEGRDTLERAIPPAGPLALPALMMRNSIHTSTAVVRTDALRRSGGFDTGLRTFEDFDLWLRIGGSGGLLALSEPLCDYRRHPAQATRDWRAMQEGWTAVAARIAAAHPREWRRIERSARAHNLEYCASLAYNAGDIPEMRRLMRRALASSALAVTRRPDGLIMTGVMACSYLPRPVQIAIGRAFVGLRRMRRAGQGAAP